MADEDAGRAAALAAIDAAQPEQLVDALASMSDRQRRSLRYPLRDHLRQVHALRHAVRQWPDHLQTLDLVVEFGTCAPSSVAWGWWRLSPDTARRASEFDLMADLLAARPRSVHKALVEAVCSPSGSTSRAWPVLRRLQDRGVLTELLDDDALAVGVVRGVWGLRSGDSDTDWRDPPADVLLHAIDVDRTVAAHVLHALGHAPALDAMSDVWPAWVATAVAAGTLPRADVLQRLLAAQDGDVRPTTARLLCKLLAALDPSDDELAAHEADLVRILADAHPAARRQAAGHLRQLATADRLVDPGAVAHAVVGPLSGQQKAAAEAALHLLAALPGDPATTAIAATSALAHPHEDVQGRALDLIDEVLPQSPPAALREQALVHLDLVAPAHRSRVAALAGVDDVDDAPTMPGTDLTSVAKRAATLPPAIRTTLRVDDALTAAARGQPPAPATFPVAAGPTGAPLTPVADAVELGEVLGFLMGGSATPLDLERAIDGLARLDGRTASPAVTSVVARQAGQNLEAGDAGTVGFLVAQAALAWAAGTRPGRLEYLSDVTAPRALDRLLRRGQRPRLLHDVVTPPPARHDYDARPDGGAAPAGLVGMVQARLYEACIISQTVARPTLALPTHADGWIDEEVLAHRVRALDSAGHRPGRFEAVAALLRLRAPDGLQGVLPRDGSTGAIATAIDGDPRADPALVRALDRPTRLGDITQAAPQALPGLTRTTPWFAVDDLPPWRRDDVVGQLLGELAEQESRHATSWWDTGRNVLPEADRLLVTWAPLGLPGDIHLLAAAATRTVLVDPDADRSSSAIDALLARAVDPDLPLAHPWPVLLAVTLGAGNRVAGVTAADAVAAAAEDGRLDPDELGGRLAWSHAAGVGKTNRVTDRLQPVVEASPVVAAVVRRALQRWVARIEDLPRDLHHLLALFEATCHACDAGVDDDAARAILERASDGRSKRAAAAGRLLDLPATAPSFAPAASAAAIVSRAERWTSTLGPAGDTG